MSLVRLIENWLRFARCNYRLLLPLFRACNIQSALTNPSKSSIRCQSALIFLHVLWPLSLLHHNTSQWKLYSGKLHSRDRQQPMALLSELALKPRSQTVPITIDLVRSHSNDDVEPRRTYYYLSMAICCSFHYCKSHSFIHVNQRVCQVPWAEVAY